MRRTRGSTLVESALALASFAVLLAGIVEAGFVMFAANAVTFAAQRAARYASVNGSTAPHVAKVSDIQSVAQSNAAPLSAGSLTINVSWTNSGNNAPGNPVQVQVIYAITPSILPIDGGVLKLQSTAAATIVQ